MKTIIVTTLAIASVGNVVFGDVLGTFGPITISATHQPTPQLPGFSTWTVSAISSIDIIAIDFAPYKPVVYAGFGFHGAMNQVTPAGVPTVYMDANSIFSLFGADPLQDSQYLVNSFAVTSAPGRFQSPTSLEAAFGKYTFGKQLAFAQIVKSDDAIVTFLGQIGVNKDNPNYRVSGTLGKVAEPGDLGLLGSMFFIFSLAGKYRTLGCCARRST